MRIHEFAKELDVPGKDIVAILEEMGEGGKTVSSSIDDEFQEKVREKLKPASKKKAVKEEEAKALAPEKEPDKAKTVKKEPVKAESPVSEAAKSEPVKKAVTQKTDEAGVPAAKVSVSGSPEAPVKKKKPNIIIVNRHGSQGGGRPGSAPASRTGTPGQNRGQGTRGNGNGTGMRPGQGLIKPKNVPRTANMMMNREEEVRPRPVSTPEPEVVEKPVPSAPEAGGEKDQTVTSVKENIQKSKESIQSSTRPVRAGSNSAGDSRRTEERRDKTQSGRGPAGGTQDSRGRDNRNFRSGDRRDNVRSGISIAFGSEQKGAGKDNRRDDSRRNKDKNRKDMSFSNEDGFRGGKQVKGSKAGKFIKPAEKPAEIKEEEKIKVIVLPESLTIKDLAEKMKVQPAVIIKKLFLQGKVVTVNQEISYEQAEEIAVEFDILCEKEVVVDVIEELLKEDEEDTSKMVKRPPVICVMGHVDHGKTSLLDCIRNTNVIDREAGGITQHIGAYVVKVGDQKITFLDTPGHEAFTAMRMRGANSTDIAILVVAADDGVMPQTVEAINHAKAAGIEIIVAVNKIDKPSANIDRVKQELSEYDLIPEDWGGSTVFAPVSAKSGEGIENLLDMILLTADILELKANPKRKARGLVIEAQLDKGRGPVATVLVQKGTLKVGDYIAAGACSGKVRAMIDDKGRRVKEAGPSTPVEILGLNDVPNAGEIFVSPENDKEAKNFAQTFISQNKVKLLDDTKNKMSLDDLFNQIQEGNLKELNLIIKADVQGSVEAVKESLVKLTNEEVVVKVIHGGVGAINESDVVLASASNAIIIGFNVRPDATAKNIAETEGVDIRLYNVIYKAIEDVEAAMKGMLDPVFEEKILGHAEIRQIFKASGVGNIAGSYVLDGTFERGCKIRISHEGEQIFEGNLASLKRFKDDVKEVKAGFECGLVFEDFNDFAELDVVEAYKMVEVPR
ncbi:MAG: translation initiation factor IF-2 [Lachnospiraceae bacterium]|nr:translation initiation factor IF-2 [Lachnospiraceae bacterium]